MRKRIPETTEITCDVCEKVVGSKGTTGKHKAELILKADGLDGGISVGDATIKLDLCDSCYLEMRSAILDIGDKKKYKDPGENLY